MFQANRNVGSRARSGTGYRSRDWDWLRSMSRDRAWSWSNYRSRSWIGAARWYESSANTRLNSTVGK